MTPEPTKPKECPFCGKPPGTLIDLGIIIGVRCYECGLRDYRTPEWWNRRASPWRSPTDLPPIDKAASLRMGGMEVSANVLVWDLDAEEHYKRHGNAPLLNPMKIGFYHFGTLQEWRIVGQNGDARIKGWTPLPEPPKE